MWYSYVNDESNILAIPIEKVQQIIEDNAKNIFPEKLEDVIRMHRLHDKILSFLEKSGKRFLQTKDSGRKLIGVFQIAKQGTYGFVILKNSNLHSQ